MKRKLLKSAALIMVVIMLTLSMSSCSVSDIFSTDKTRPEDLKVKTDLKDAVFTFTYGELREVLTPDKVAALFEDYDEFNNDTTIDLSYNDIYSRFWSDSEDENDFDKIMGLLSDEEKAQLTANSEQVLKYFVDSMNKVKKEKPITECNESFWTNGDFKFTQSGVESDARIKQAAKYFEHFVVDGANSKLSEGKAADGRNVTKEGEDLKDIVYLLGSDTGCALTMNDVESVISSLQYDKEPYEEEYTDENGKTAKHTVYAITGITRIISIKLKNNDACVEKAFSPRDKAVVLDEMKKAQEYFTVDDYSVSYDGCTIFVTFNAVTDNILTATYDKNMIINTSIVGTGSLEHLGKQDLSFGCTDRMDYKFGWAEEAE